MLVEHFGSSNVTAVNLSNVQLGVASQRAQGAAFAQMDAANLGFEDESFDVVMCVEAAFHFDTRDDFLREALRVLKPGGLLLMTDILYRFSFPVTENYVKDPTALCRPPGGRRLRFHSRRRRYTRIMAAFRCSGTRLAVERLALRHL